MKVSIYKRDDGLVDVLVQAAPGNGKPPVLIQARSAETMRNSLLPVIKAIRGPRIRPGPDAG